MAKMDPLQYIESIRPLIKKGLEMQEALRTEAMDAIEPPKDGTEESFVDAGAVVSFTERLTKQQREDVLDGTLLAQLVANAFTDRTEIKAWYNKYVEVLSNIGWVIQSFDFQQYMMQGQSFAINKALLDIVKHLLTAKGYDLIERTIDSLKGDDNQRWWEVFSKESSGPSENGNFQVCPCHQDESGQVIMVLGAFYFQASSTNEMWFWFRYSTSNMRFFRGTQTCTLNEDVYGQVRQEIKDLLRAQARRKIKKLWNL